MELLILAESSECLSAEMKHAVTCFLTALPIEGAGLQSITSKSISSSVYSSPGKSSYVLIGLEWN